MQCSLFRSWHTPSVCFCIWIVKLQYNIEKIFQKDYKFIFSIESIYSSFACENSKLKLTAGHPKNMFSLGKPQKKKKIPPLVAGPLRPFTPPYTRVYTDKIS